MSLSEKGEGNVLSSILFFLEISDVQLKERCRTDKEAFEEFKKEHNIRF